MSSGFVSGGSLDQPAERDDAWRQAQEELEAKRRSKEEAEHQGNGKSLYEVLQANKAAKQEAFEESIRLKNQFRSLNDDEVEFLDSVSESTRAKAAAIQKETAEQLAAFRKHQEEVEKAALALGNSGSPVEEEETWIASGRKRKKGKEKEIFKGVKLRKSSSSANRLEAAATQDTASTTTATTLLPETAEEKNAPTQPQVTKTLPRLEPQNIAIVNTNPAQKFSPSPTIGLGLGNYSSDEDD